MIFSSIEFTYFFLPLVFVTYFLLNKVNPLWGKWSLVLFSFVFYWYGSHNFVYIFSISVVMNYLFGTFLNHLHGNTKKHWGKLVLTAGILMNVLILGYYKYTDFILENINTLIHSSIALKNIILPIGISFYTFQLIGYLVDSYRGETEGYKLIDYLLFITFFPQLIVGPIVHHKDVVSQYEDEKNMSINYKNLSSGIFLFLLGASKKLFIADALTPLAESAFHHVGDLTMVDAWFSSVGYTIAYYFDLSGYADMAIGLGLMFNIKIPQNFNSPYKATNFADYWRRWHITLSKFLGDYIFRSVKKKGGSTTNYYYAIFITFLVSGIWHGAGWNFILWGVINGCFVILSHVIDNSKIKIPPLIGWFVTFCGVILMWMLFVSESIHDFWMVVKRLFELNSFSLHNNTYATPKQLIFIILGTIIALVFPNSTAIMKRFKPNKWFFLVVFILSIVAIFYLDRVGKFLYFQF